MAAADPNAIMSTINDTCRARGRPYSNYSCQTVSWDDVQRGMVGEILSCWGANITDTRLYEKRGTQLFTVRSDNWNEKLGKLSADKVAVVTGNHKSGTSDDSLKTVSLEYVLKNIGSFGAYAGLASKLSLSDAKLDSKVSIRFQTTFLPVADEAKSSVEFATQAYNYNTTSDDDPKNLLLLCTTQGMSIRQDGAGAKMLYLHKVDASGAVSNHWLEAERTAHKVGGAQHETEEEKADAIARGKATSKVIGTEAMGHRFNVLMTVQVPLKQTNTNRDWSQYDFCSSIVQKSEDEDEEEDENYPTVKSNAARVSIGSEVKATGAPVPKLNIHPKRHPSEHVTITVVTYNTVSGGVPSSADVIAAIDDLEALYASCSWTGRLADDGASFMRSQLEVKDIFNISRKVSTQPPEGPSSGRLRRCGIM